MSEHVGQLLGNYRLTRLLGRGGFAEVYLGEHIYLKTHAAIKILHVELTMKDQQQFIQEARTVARLKHYNIVRILDFGVDSRGFTPYPYLVMDFAPNGTLRQLHPRASIVPLNKVISYVEQIASALQYAHDERLIHRDVKPENMLLDSKHEILLSDFGIAVVAHSSSSLSTQAYCGTILYSAPEQISGWPRPASDQYALAIAVYEWLTGTRPFTGNITQLIYQHMSISPAPLRERVPTIPLTVEQVVLKALSKDPQQRFENILAFAQALKQASMPQSAPRGSRFLTFQWDRGWGDNLRWKGVSWSSDGSRIVLCTAFKTIQVWDVVARNLILTYPEYSVQLVAWSPDGSRIASAGLHKTVNVWNSETGENLLTFSYWGGHWPEGVQAIVWSPDGSRIASCYYNQKVEVWDPTTGSIMLSDYYASDWDTSDFMDWDCDTPYPIHEIGWSPDCAHIACSGDVGIEVWNSVSGKKCFTCEDHDMFAWSPDGKYIALTGGKMGVQVWDVATRNRIVSYADHSENFFDALAWSPDGKHIAVADYDRGVQVWNPATGALVFTYPGHTDKVNAIAWSPDSRYIASGSKDKTVQVWNANTGVHVFTYLGHSDSVSEVTWLPNGLRIVSVSRDDVQVWQAV